MPKYRVNRRGVAQARELIDAHQYRVRSRWADVQPRPRSKTPSSSPMAGRSTPLGTSRSRMANLTTPRRADAFVFGDFRRLHRMGLIACYYRAAEWEHTEVMVAADTLLLHLDKSKAWSVSARSASVAPRR